MAVMKDDDKWMWDVRVGRQRRFGWCRTRKEALAKETETREALAQTKESQA
jgi:hypothetical protein